jgi:hypothetical protein
MKESTKGCCLSLCLAELIFAVGDIFHIGSHLRSQVLEFLSEGNVLSAKDNISGGSVNVFLSNGRAGMYFFPPFLISFDSCHFHREYQHA